MSLTVGYFADPHVGSDELNCKTRRPALSAGKMRELMGIIAARQADIVICLGDLIDGRHGPEEAGRDAAAAAEIMKESCLPFFCLPGNHDLAELTHREFFDAAGIRRPPFSYEKEGVTFVFLDACFSDDGTPEGRAYFSDGEHPDWTNSYVPRSQTEKLKDLLIRGGEEDRFVILSHQSLDPGCEPRHVVRNAGEIRGIIDGYGRGRVIEVVCGHYHRGREAAVGGVPYVNLPALCDGESIPPGACRIKHYTV